jgi:hypothetical protein
MIIVTCTNLIFALQDIYWVKGLKELFLASTGPVLPTSKPFGPGLVKPGTRPGALGPGRPGGARPMPGNSVDLVITGIVIAVPLSEFCLVSGPSVVRKGSSHWGGTHWPTLLLRRLSV